MCWSSSTPTVKPAAAPPAPEPVPESVTPAVDAGAESVKAKRKGLTSKRTDLNVSAVGNSGTGLNVPV